MRDPANLHRVASLFFLICSFDNIKLIIVIFLNLYLKRIFGLYYTLAQIRCVREIFNARDKIFLKFYQLFYFRLQMILSFFARKNCLLKNSTFRFAQQLFLNQKYQYYRQIGEYLSLKVGKINYEISYSESQNCHVYGIKALVQDSQADTIIQGTFPKLATENNQEKKQQTPNNNKKQQKQPFELTDQLGQIVHYSYDRTCKQVVPFETAIKIAEQFGMDLCILQQNQSQPKLVLKDYRKSIYKSFYDKFLKKNENKNNQKLISITEKTQIFDIIHKAKNIERLVKEGTRKFKIVSDSDSQNAKSNIQKIIQLINVNQTQKQNESQLVLEDKQKSNSFSKQIQERWVAYVSIHKQIPLDADFIEKKFKRLVIEQKLSKIPKKKRKEVDLTLFPLQLQQQYLKCLKETGTPFPQQFKDLQETLSFKSTKQMIAHDFKNFPKRKNIDRKNLQIQHDFQKDQYKEEDIKQMMDSTKNLSMRTVEQIVKQMEQIKQGNSFLSGFDMHRLKLLQNQLKQTLYSAGYNKEI